MNYSIKEVSKMVNLPHSTIRYYDKEGLLPFL
ncbi:MerR family DNA-binding transcriptional regulator [Clostridium hominis]